VANRRQRQAAELIHEELGNLLQRRARDPRLSEVTITGVEVSPDLENAYIYFSVLGDRAAKTEALRGLERAAGFLRRELGEAVSLRITPTLTFRLDESLEQGLKIDALLDSITLGEEEQQEDEQ
jgi:ribosome-binding factor A